MKVLDILWLLAAISLPQAIGNFWFFETSTSNNDVISPNPLCPDPVPEEGSACESPFNCEVGKVCCPDNDSICVTEKSCYCDELESMVMCYDNVYQITCPSVCPTTYPETNDDCSLDNGIVCNYGNPLDCNDTDLQFDYERQCSCYDGKFSCVDNACQVPCPAAQPEEGEHCLPFPSGRCDYGSLCCPDDGGECVPDKSCYCTGNSSNCYESYLTIPCPSICPETPPNNMDSCDIDSRFQCNYGEAFTCENNMDEFGSSSFDYEKQCTCKDGKFSCNSNACPEPCPDVKPEFGSPCSPFVTRSCGYGTYCCDAADGKACVSKTECFCGSDLTTTCYEPSINCPSKCPEIKPENGQSCDMESRLICMYQEGTHHTSKCNCLQGIFICTD